MERLGCSMILILVMYVGLVGLGFGSMVEVARVEEDDHVPYFPAVIRVGRTSSSTV